MRGHGGDTDTDTDLVSAATATAPPTGRSPHSPWGLADTLDAVHDLLTSTCAALGKQWVSLVRSDRDGVMGADDLPAWMARLLRAGGKLIRPTMCHWGYVAAGADDRSPGLPHMVTAGAALETLHLFGLIHDDIMDESETRRGRPTPHAHASAAHRAVGGRGSSATFGVNMAILLGDLAHHHADRLAAELPELMRRQWFDVSVELIAGQREDLTAAAVGCADLQRAGRIATLKSGAYTIERPLDLGASAAAVGRDLTDEVRGALAGYGRHIGSAFALRDDILGVWGDPDTTGKPSGDDLLHRKPTQLWIRAEQTLTGPARAALDRVGTPEAADGDVWLLQTALDDCGVRSWAELTIGDHVNAALTYLSTPALAPQGAKGLTDMAATIAWRQA
ncbi:MAG TPA: polyprenyl synthetase family protein [Dermatophilaceae bacterium]|nr:polyprenyl synthetase family protein [Dermatophilaceae bacterium]